MKKRLFITITVFALVLAGAVYANADVFAGRNKVYVSETTLFGDAGAMEGVSLSYSAALNKVCRWDVSYDFSSGTARVETSAAEEFGKNLVSYPAGDASAQEYYVDINSLPDDLIKEVFMLGKNSAIEGRVFSDDERSFSFVWQEDGEVKSALYSGDISSDGKRTVIAYRPRSNRVFGMYNSVIVSVIEDEKLLYMGRLNSNLCNAYSPLGEGGDNLPFTYEDSFNICLCEIIGSMDLAFSEVN